MGWDMVLAVQEIWKRSSPRLPGPVSWPSWPMLFWKMPCALQGLLGSLGASWFPWQLGWPSPSVFSAWGSSDLRHDMSSSHELIRSLSSSASLLQVSLFDPFPPSPDHYSCSGSNTFLFLMFSSEFKKGFGDFLCTTYSILEPYCFALLALLWLG